MFVAWPVVGLFGCLRYWKVHASVGEGGGRGGGVGPKRTALDGWRVMGGLPCAHKLIKPVVRYVSTFCLVLQHTEKTIKRHHWQQHEQQKVYNNKATSMALKPNGGGSNCKDKRKWQRRYAAAFVGVHQTHVHIRVCGKQRAMHSLILLVYTHTHTCMLVRMRLCQT